MKRIHSMLAGVPVGPSYPVRIMGVINVSPESFYKGSIPATARDLARAAERMEKEGADFIDVGAMSSAPYLKTKISEAEEAGRLAWAVRLIRKNSSLPISVDSYRSLPAAAGLEAGGKILNDITGLCGDPKMARVAKHAKGMILMAHPIAISRHSGESRTAPIIKIMPVLSQHYQNYGVGRNPVCKPSPKSMFKTWIPAFAGMTNTGHYLRQSTNESAISLLKNILRCSLKIAKSHGIPLARIVLDPGIGFFRDMGIPWWKWDLQVLRGLKKLESLGLPLLVGVSRKSFIGEILGEKNPSKRLAGSLAATAAAVNNGASIIRTHDVGATRDAVRVTKMVLQSSLS